VDNKRRGIFTGELYPVNPHEASILGFKCYPSITKIVGTLELVVIVVPAESVPQVLKEAAAKGAKGAVIISGGFSEVGNQHLAHQLHSIMKKTGIRILGPNCLGVYDPKTGVDMLFLPETKVLTSGDEVVATPRPMSGHIAVVTQSGAFGVAILDYMAGEQLGLSRFVSFGNRIDVNEAEMLHYLLSDQQTRVILLYVESLTKVRAFRQIAKKVTRVKPIIALKAGRTEAGAQAARSHTGAIAGSDKLYDVLFKQVGIVRAYDMEEFLDIGEAFASQPPAAGNSVGVITSAGGPAILAVDECESRGLAIRRFSKTTTNKLEKLKKEGKIPSFAAILNPLDLTGSVTSEMFELGTKILLADSDIDGLIVLGAHHSPALSEDYVDKIVNLSKNSLKPIVACDIGETEMARYIRSRFDKRGIPAYSSPEDAAKAMTALVHYGQYLKKFGVFETYIERWVKQRLSRRFIS
jgi:acyl-CoA synthetase (NDP forming)